LGEAKLDVLVGGAGCAGMRAAIEAHDAGADVALLSKIHPVRSHSGAAEGGINAALGNASADNPEEHAYDTVKGSDYLGDQDAIQILCDEAPDDVHQPQHRGSGLSQTKDGRIAQRPLGAAGKPRTAYAADITGHVLVHVLYEQMMKREIPTYEEFFAWKLVMNDDRCQGVIAWDLLNGGLKSIGAKTVILATGGAGRLYVGTTNAYSCTGDGMALALRVGVPLKDMEMMQFHPTTLSPTGVLITEGTRGEGAFLLNSENDRFLKRYAPNAMELASRDVISRAEQTEIDEGRGVDGNVLLDLRHLGAEKILERLHGTRELSMVFAGVDPIYEPIPVRPGARPEAAARPQRGRAPVADPRRAGADDARELRRLSARGADGETRRDRRAAPGALPERRRRRQGRDLQQRPDTGARARLPARPRRVHGRRGPRAQGEPWRSRAAVRLPRPRRRKLHEAHDRPLGQRPSRSGLEAGA